MDPRGVEDPITVSATGDPGSPGHHQATAPTTSGLAIGALVAAFLLPVVGLVLGYLARRDIDNSRGAKSGRGLATAAIVVGWIIVAPAIVFGAFALIGALLSTLSGGAQGSLQDNAYKLTLAASVVLVFFSLLLLILYLAGKTRGKVQTPLARLIFLGPAIVLLVVGLIIPAVATFIASFKDPDSVKAVGWANYAWIFGTPDNRQFLINTALWIIITPVFSTALGLTLALLMDRMKRESLPKSLIFMPMAISFVGASIIWGLVYEFRQPGDPQVGLLSAVVSVFGIDPPNWLLWQPWNNFLLMIIMIWIQTGFAMVVLSAAVKAIPADVTEAAMLDGASGWKLFTKVTVPMIRGTLVVVLTTIAIGVLKVFDIVRTMTNGNFGTQVVANEMYAQSFVQFDAGRGSALAVVLFVAVIPLVIYNIVQLRKEQSIR
jgi:alpha-glucoside transport system permease protein